ncbi:Ig-like domain-containing protein, partial [bacterium 210820-DFI.6.37]|nr:Ig-like domain-containing protein [bacterium 210820-DFI.6.37]
VEPTISLSKTSASLTAGSTLRLSAAVTGEESDVTWTSSDESIAAVNADGLVTAKKAGKATITAEANGVKATCVITVTAKVTAPAAPKTVKAASAAYNKVKISWSKASGAAGYEVYQYNAKTKKYAKVADTKSLSYTKSGLTTGTKYTYKVRAYKKASDGTKVYSAYTKAVSAKPALSKVTGVKAKNSGKKLAKVTWKKVAGASGYKVTRATKKAGKYKVVKTIKSGKTVKLTNKKLKKGKTYYYKVRAYKKVGKKTVYGAYSSAAKVKIKK